jgi:hypothetical protein
MTPKISAADYRAAEPHNRRHCKNDYPENTHTTAADYLRLAVHSQAFHVVRRNRSRLKFSRGSKNPSPVTLQGYPDTELRLRVHAATRNDQR